MQQNGSSKVVAGIIVIIAVALIAVAAGTLTKKEEQQSTGSDTTTTSQETPSVSRGSAVYKDGTYTVNDTYPSPGGEEDIKVMLTLKDNKVTAVEVTQEANQAESAEYQGQFQEGYKARVIGKAIDTLELNRVSGSSLTTQAFDEALEQIRNQAKA